MERVDYESMVIQELLSAHDRGELNVSPWYQRRAVWTNSHKAYLVNSLFVKMPIPTIYVRHTIDIEYEKTVKEVVDGQQRVRSILDYRDGKFSARHPEHSRRVYYKSLTASQRQAFLFAKLPVAYLIGANDSDVIEIFGRLNAVSKTLNAQEKRAAQYSGEFHQFCLRQAVDRLPIWRQLSIFSATEISRMAEVQFMAELALAVLNGISDFSAARINSAYRTWDEDFPEATRVASRFERVFTAIASLNDEIVRDSIFNRSPIFYSLFLALDQREKIPSRKVLEGVMTEIDSRFYAERTAGELKEMDNEFIRACTASTQRIRSRKIRLDYIASFL